MTLYEEGDSMVHRAVLDMQESQGRTLEIPLQDASITHTYMETGGYHYGFHHKVAKDSTWG